MTTPQPSAPKGFPRPDPKDLDAVHPSIGTLVKETSEHFSTLLRSEIELAKSEVTKEVKKGVTGSIFLVIAAVVALLALPFVFFTLAEVLIAIGLPRWAGFAIITGFFFLLAGFFAFLGIRKLKKIKKPERTVDSLKKNKEIANAFKSSEAA